MFHAVIRIRLRTHLKIKNAPINAAAIKAKDGIPPAGAAAVETIVPAAGAAVDVKTTLPGVAGVGCVADAAAAACFAAIAAYCDCQYSTIAFKMMLISHPALQ